MENITYGSTWRTFFTSWIQLTTLVKCHMSCIIFSRHLESICFVYRGVGPFYHWSRFVIYFLVLEQILIREFAACIVHFFSTPSPLADRSFDPTGPSPRLNTFTPHFLHLISDVLITRILIRVHVNRSILARLTCLVIDHHLALYFSSLFLFVLLLALRGDLRLYVLRSKCSRPGIRCALITKSAVW